MQKPFDKVFNNVLTHLHPEYFLVDFSVGEHRGLHYSKKKIELKTNGNSNNKKITPKELFPTTSLDPTKGGTTPPSGDSSRYKFL